MIDPKAIPHLIKLLDDDSLEIRELITKELSAFGSSLKNTLGHLDLELNDRQRDHLSDIFQQQKKVSLENTWNSWFDQPAGVDAARTDYIRLEKALTLLSTYISRSIEDVSLMKLLDNLADEFRAKYKVGDVKHLAKFLFRDKGLKGNEKNYYDIRNSDLVQVIQKREGIPISLACVYILVGYRLGFVVEGCHFPGHFLAKVEYEGKTYFVDCFSSGQFINQKELMRLREDVLEGMENILVEKTEIDSIIRRYLANLIRAYQIQEKEESALFMMELFKKLEYHLTDKRIATLTPEEIIADIKLCFESGQLVSHKRYGYLGIVVDADVSCMATDDWYYGNQTQPIRHQPWYHVLVDGSDQITYVAESNLSLEIEAKKFDHPLLSYFFTKNKKGSYIRNNNPWPDTDF